MFQDVSAVKYNIRQQTDLLLMLVYVGYLNLRGDDLYITM